MLPAAPLIIPHISPTTSLQKFETKSAFLISCKAWRAPRILFEAIEINGTSEAAATAIPIISKITPIKIINNIINKGKIILLELDNIFCEVILKKEEIMSVTKNILIAHNFFLLPFLFLLLFLPGLGKTYSLQFIAPIHVKS
jgi:hypothetical protein